MTIDNLLPSEREKLLAKLEAVEHALAGGNLRAAEEALKGAEQTVIEAQPATFIDQLRERREQRLFKEAYEQLPEGERADFERLYGHSATMRRLAAEAVRQADEAWQQQQLTKLNAEYEGDMWEGDTSLRQRAPAANWDKLLAQSEKLEKAKLERIRAREERQITAEVWQEEQARILAGMERDEAERFMGLMQSQPSMLQRLEAFKKSRGLNSIADVTDPGELFNIGLQNDEALHPWRRYEDNPVKSLPGEHGEEVEDLYRQALDEMTKGE